MIQNKADFSFALHLVRLIFKVQSLKLTPRFSRQLQPIFEAAAKALENEEKLVFGKVDCDNDGAICKEFMVNKVVPGYINSNLLLFFALIRQA